jgi:hypothetical protein
LSELRRTVSLRTPSGGTFDFVIMSRDQYGHSALTSLPEQAHTELNNLLASFTRAASRLIDANTVWEDIGK